MRRIKIEAEISARSYKKLCESMKGFNRKQLWKVMDHYIFHIMEDKHVEELLQILKTFKETNSFDEPHEQKEEVAAQFEMANERTPFCRKVFATPLTPEDLASSKDRIDLLFDVNYFQHLTRDVAIENAKRLVTYAKTEDMPGAPHWHLIASSADFLDLEDDEG